LPLVREPAMIAGMEFAERAARNEEIFRGVNERIEQGAQRHQLTTATPFHCECGQASCFEYVQLAPAEYERVAAQRYRFVVVPGHELEEIERVVERHDGFFVVEKIGEAREQIDQDHPQARHHS
jgi:hypothetical protein